MKKSFLVQIIFSFVLISLLGDNIFAQKSLTKDVLKLTSSIGKTTETINLNPLADCTGPGQMIFDDGTFENGVGWLNTVTDGRYVSLFTPPAYPWQFNSLCLPLTRTGTTTDFTFDIVVYDGTGGGTPGTLVTTIPGVTAAGVPSYPSFTFYSFDISSVPQLVSGSYYIGIKYNPSVYQNFYSMDDESITTPLHPAYGYANTTWNAIETLFTSARALGYRTLGPSLGPGLATNPNPVNFASGVTITNLNLSWTNPGGATSNKVYFGTDPNNMSLIHSGSLVSSVNAPTPLNYSTFYFWRVDEISGITTTYGTQWCFTTAAAPCGVYATPFIENFELADFPPLCWTLVAGGSYNWIRSTACSGYGVGTASAEANFYSFSGSTPFDLITFQFNASTLTTPTLKFDYAYATYSGEVDELDIYYSTNAGTNWTLLLAMPGGATGILNTGGTVTSIFVPTSAQWATETIALPAGSNMVKFEAISAYGNNLYVDNIKVEEPASLPIFSINPTSKNFGFVSVGSSSPDQIFTISNTGGSTLTITSGNISIVGANANQFILTDANSYPINLTVGQSATVKVKFSPTSTGAKTASLQIIDNTTDATHTVPLTGVGITVPYSTDFETFTAGQRAACQDPVNWTTWSILPCNVTEDPFISSNYAHGGTKSVVIIQNNDFVKPLGSKTSGTWTISFWIYIPTGKSGYFNTLNGFTPDTYEWGMDAFFDVGGAGRLDTTGAGGAGVVVPFTWTVAQWNQVKVVIDLDTHQAEFWIGTGAPVQVATWDWTQGGTKNNRLAANDFFGGATTDEMYMDDYSISQATTTFQLSVSISNGWNMVSVPGLNTAGMDITHWWINHVGTVYKFVPGSGYTGITTTVPGQGYWMKNSSAQIYNTGDEWPAGGIQLVNHDPINASLGWNMFGGYEDAVDPATLTTVPAGKIVYPIYKFVPGTGYQTATSIVPGYGYWVKVSAACQIIVPNLMAKSNQKVAEFFKDDWGRITLTDAAGSTYTLYAVKGDVDLNQYELPPLPPAGLFDVRFGSGRIAENLSTIQSIEMRGVTYPVRVRVENMDITLQDETGTIIKSAVKSGQEIVISNPSVSKLMLTGTSVPTDYSLEQNYPNPFNPTTTIKFSIPEAANVTLNIYNMLGQKVGELVNGKMEAGRYSYQWNAKNVATGMYIYELRTEKFVSIKKMLLLK